MNQTIKIGTRGSQLALFQANVVKAALEEKFPDYTFQIIIIKTKGDIILDVPLSKIGDKGLFTKELEIAMFDDKIDMAVHSLKDLPTQFPDGIKLGATLKRGEVRDALISTDKRTLSSLTKSDVIATSSLRRKAQLLRINKDFNIVEIRGNVNTRIRKMQEGYCDVMVMAGAGLQRLGLDAYISELIDADLMIPACSQGAIAVEIRENDRLIEEIVSQINDHETALATQAERAFLRTLEGGCQIPVGSYSSINGDLFEITGFIAGINGEEYIKDKAQGPAGQAVEIAKNLAEELLSKGGREILDEIRNLNLYGTSELPLKGKVFISTRALDQDDTLPDLLTSKGAEIISFPMIEIKTSILTLAETEVFKNINTYQWIFFTSRNGIIHFFKHLIGVTGSSVLPDSVKIAVIGGKTASELEYYGFKASMIGKGKSSADLVSQFRQVYNPKSMKILLVLGNLANDTLKSQLAPDNAVERINVYQTYQPKSADPSVIERIKNSLYDLILFTSPSTFQHFCTIVGKEVIGQLKMASIGSTTSKTIRDAGYEPFLTAQKSNAEGLTEEIIKFYHQ